jgi:hypothetical protein
MAQRDADPRADAASHAEQPGELAHPAPAVSFGST